MERKLITKRDAVILIIFIAVAIIICAYSLSLNGSKKIAEITVEGRIVKEINLDAVQDEEIITLENGVKIRIYDKAIAFFESDCNDKTCVNTGALFNVGEVAACVPNKTVINITSLKEGDVDVITY